MNNPPLFDENHPGWKYLTVREKNQLVNGDEAEQAKLRDILLNGRPADQNHPGFDNLSPQQQQRF